MRMLQPIKVNQWRYGREWGCKGKRAEGRTLDPALKADPLAHATLDVLARPGERGLGRYPRLGNVWGEGRLGLNERDDRLWVRVDGQLDDQHGPSWASSLPTAMATVWSCILARGGRVV